MRRYAPPKKKNKYVAGSDHEFVPRKKDVEQEEENAVATMEGEEHTEEEDGDGDRKKKKKEKKAEGKVFTANLNPYDSTEIWVRANAGTSRETVLADPKVQKFLASGVNKLKVIYFFRQKGAGYS